MALAYYEYMKPTDSHPWALEVFTLLAAVAAVAAALAAFMATRPAAISPVSSDRITVASITPAGTDLVLGIGAADHLVAVSDLDEDRNGTVGLPRVGDFDHVDWEKLAAAKPRILLTQFGGRLPTEMRQRCDDLGIQLIDIRLDVLEDVYVQADRLGEILGEQSNEQTAVAELKRRLSDLAAKTAAGPRVRAVIFDATGTGLIGPGTFHDQLLGIAGGVNVAASFGKPYIMMDREQLMALSPDVVLDLEPVPPTTPREMRQTARFWQSLPDLPAVRSGRIRVITEPYCLRPGWHLADLAQIFAHDLR
jgi:iron complex transport system substrate-binding protein